MFCTVCGMTLQSPYQEFCYNCGSKILNQLFENTPGLMAVAIISSDGLPILSTLPKGSDETQVAAISSALLSIAERALIEIEKGEIEHLLVNSNEGYLIALKAGPNAILTISTTKDARIGLVLLDCIHVCNKISELLKKGK